MINNLSKYSPAMPDPLVKSLIPLARQVPDPVNYLAGLSVSEFIIPKNIIMFSPGPDKLKLVTSARHVYQYVLIVNLCGRGAVVINDRAINLSAGHVLLVPPGEKIGYARIADSDLVWFHVTFRFDKSEPLAVIANRVLPLSKQGVSFLHGMINDYMAPDRSAPSIVGGITFQLWLLLKELIKIAMDMPPGMAEHQAVQDHICAVQRYLYDHIRESVRIRDVARYVHVSINKLQRLFKRAMGMNLGAYIRIARVNYAAELAVSSDMTFSEISDHCGFNSVFTFSRSFKKVFKVSPRQYRVRLHCRRLKRLEKPGESVVRGAPPVALPVHSSPIEIYWGSV
ncbi:MAG: AraC family transcriptional regulator [Kiritimatiellae bacterium]|nr:AraC family transcriptional regulator [Kiritimatiellia bacterium]